MKCPFRKIIKKDDTTMHEYTYEEFADCYRHICMAFINKKIGCKRLQAICKIKEIDRK